MGTGSDTGHCPLGCTVALTSLARLLPRRLGRAAPDSLSVLLSSGVGAGAPTPARPCLLSLLAASLLSCLAVAKSFLCRAPRAASLLLSLGGKALRQMKSKYRGPTLLPAQGVPWRGAQPEGSVPAPSCGASTAAGAVIPARRRPAVPRGSQALVRGCRSCQAGLAGLGWQPGPRAPRPRTQRAFVRAQPAGVTPPRERTGRSPAADCSRRAWPLLGARFISAGSRDRGVSAGAGWQRARPAGPAAPAALWLRRGAAERSELRAPAAGRGLCLGTVPWAVRDSRMAGTDGGCSRGGWREQWEKHPRGAGAAHPFGHRAGRESGSGCRCIAAGSCQGECKGCLAVAGLPPAMELSLQRHPSVAT